MATVILAPACKLPVLRAREERPASREGGSTASAAARLDPKRVVVAAFENRTGDPSLDPVSRVAAEWVTRAISGIRIDVVPSAEAFDIPGAGKDDGKPAARRCRCREAPPRARTGDRAACRSDGSDRHHRPPSLPPRPSRPS